MIASLWQNWILWADSDDLKRAPIQVRSQQSSEVSFAHGINLLPRNWPPISLFLLVPDMIKSTASVASWLPFGCLCECASRWSARVAIGCQPVGLLLRSLLGPSLSVRCVVVNRIAYVALSPYVFAFNLYTAFSLRDSLSGSQPSLIAAIISPCLYGILPLLVYAASTAFFVFYAAIHILYN